MINETVFPETVIHEKPTNFKTVSIRARTSETSIKINCQITSNLFAAMKSDAE